MLEAGKNRILIRIGCSLLLLFIVGCIQTSKKDGTLEGKITIGPLCPVERFPPDPACKPSQETYDAYQVAVWTLDKKTMIAEIKPNLDGNYKIELPEGNYVVDLENPHLFGSNLPAAVKISPAQTTTFDIDIDTGIR